jgi:diketogulonate reductase-like aldo/keto reductase
MNSWSDEAILKRGVNLIDTAEQYAKFEDGVYVYVMTMPMV